MIVAFWWKFGYAALIKRMSKFCFCLPVLFLATAPLGYILGGGWSFLTAAVLPLSLFGLDFALGGAKARTSSSIDQFILSPGLYVILQVAATVWAGAIIALAHPSLTESLGLTISIGLCAGVFGNLAAHELVHRRSETAQSLGLIMLAVIGYMHFRIAHLHGHHRHAATKQDPATARRGESVYRFLIRSIIGQLAETWAHEVARLKRLQRSPWRLDNRMIRYALIQAVIAAAIAAFSPRAFAFWAGQAMIAIVLVELFNYIAHYSLERQVDRSGVLERLAPHHSWNSRRRMNNWSLFNMGNHSDHHRRPTASYEELTPTAGAAELPTGYAGAILMALVPPLWRRVMDERAAEHMRSTA